MATIPETAGLTGFEIGIYPTKTYAMDLEKGRIAGFADGLESMKQVIYCALSTERSEYDAYSDNYGAELMELIGKPMSYVLPELERRIKEALEWDTRISAVDGFAFEIDGRKVRATFTVHTDFGDIESESEVEA